MPLSAGDKLGPYEILALVGAGGMGQVYRARDSRLHRDVAIKISSEKFSDRFEREARAVAALSHPNICTLFDVGPDYLVMEFIDGESPKGPMALEDALAIARQIAEALDAAHEKGIVHRDLKPGNIKITSDGRVKVLDFGLARIPEAPAGNPQNSPTMTISPTRAGIIMGTAAYMAPEQARGKVVDKRADIWAFGVVLYELLTGHGPFQGDDLNEILASVIKEKPDLTVAPVEVRRLLEKCLEKDPKKRLRDIGDVWTLLDSLSPVQPATAKSNKWFWPVVAAALAAGLGLALWAPWRPALEPRTVTRSVMSFSSYGGYYLALSRDGTRLVYSQRIGGGRPQLRMRMMDQLEGHPVPGAEPGYYSAFSPDGQWIAYTTNSAPYKLRRIPVTGGTPVAICDVCMPVSTPNTGQFTWGSDDQIIFPAQGGLMTVPAAGGTPRQLTTIDTNSGQSMHDAPQLLPGGRAVLFTIYSGAALDSGRIATLDLKTGSYRPLVNSGYRGRYIPTGHLVFARGSTLYAAPFDLKRLAIIGPETPVLEGVGSGDYTVSDSSVIVFRALGSGRLAKLEWTDRQGNRQPLPEPPQNWGVIALSPNGKLLAGSINDSSSGQPRSDIWLDDLDRHTLTRLTSDGTNHWPIWTPDGKWVTYSNRGSQGVKPGIYRVPADKSGPTELLVAAETTALPGAWTPDGKFLVYMEAWPGKAQSWILPAPGSGTESKPRPFSRGAFNEIEPWLSPNGKWIAYSSDESGKYEIYVEPFPGPGGKFQISTHGGQYPMWALNGRELYYAELDSTQWMAVETQIGTSFHAGQLEALFKLNASSINDVNVALSTDPKRFLVAWPEAVPSGSFITITNWFDDLRRRAPVGN